MIYFLAVIAGILGAVVGWFVTGAIAVYVAGLLGMSDFEGGRGMLAFLGVGPIGGLISMIVAIWLVLRLGGPAPFGRTFGQLALVLVAIALVVGAAIGVRLATLDVYTNSLPPYLEFEVRAPAGTIANGSGLRVELHTDKNTDEGLLSDRWVAAEGGAMTISGSVLLAFKTSSRLLVVSLPDQPTRLFRLRLSRDPRSTATLGEWQRADHTHAAGEDQPRAAPADDPVEVRYRVRRAGEE